MVSLNPLAYFNLPADFITSFLKSQFTTLPYPTHNFSGQRIIVTGGNVGLGLEAARHFVRLGASVILACRSIEKGEKAKLDIEESTGTKNTVEVWHVDLTSYASVKEFCKRAETLDRLDAVVENAGLATPHFELIEKEMESTITVNVISTFLMALLLLPKMRESALKYNIVPRLTIVASDAHEQARFREQLGDSIFEELKESKYQPDRYNVSKLLEILVVRELAQAMDASGKPKVILNTLTPGFCHSELMRHATFPLSFLGWIGKLLIARTTEMGSRTLVAAAMAGPETHGVYMTDCQVGRVSSWVRSEKGVETQERVYKELMGILGGVQTGVTSNV